MHRLTKKQIVIRIDNHVKIVVKIEFRLCGHKLFRPSTSCGPCIQSVQANKVSVVLVPWCVHACMSTKKRRKRKKTKESGNAI